MGLTYQQITGRLEQIETDLGERQEPFAEAAEKYHRLTRDYELRIARAMMAADGKTATEKKAQAVIAVAAAADSPLEELKAAEGAYEGAKAAVRVLETRATIGMSLAKGAMRDPTTFPDGPTFRGSRGWSRGVRGRLWWTQILAATFLSAAWGAVDTTSTSTTVATARQHESSGSKPTEKSQTTYRSTTCAGIPAA